MSWEPTVDVADWGRLRIVVGGRDVTFFRGVPTVVQGWQDTDPYGSNNATLAFGQITEFDELGVGELAWLDAGARVRLDKTVWSPAKNRWVVEKNLWFGFLDRPELDGTVSFSASGWLSGRLAAQVHQPPLRRKVMDVGRAAYVFIQNTAGRYDLHPAGGIDLGLDMECRGDRSMTSLGFLDHILSLGVLGNGDSLTVLPDTARGPRSYTIGLRDLNTVHATVDAGAHGVKPRLSSDLYEQPTHIFGEGVAPDGARWRNAIYPNLGPAKTVPPYPYTDGRSFGAGTVDSDTDTGDGVTVLIVELSGNGMLAYTDRLAALEGDAEYTDDVTEAVETAQDRAGRTVNARVNPDVWKVIFGGEFENQSLAQAHFAPLWADRRAVPWNVAPDGTFIGKNPAYDHGIIPVHEFVSYGEGVRKSRARRNARAAGKRSATQTWTGTLDLTSDPAEMSRFELRAGMNIKIRHLLGKPNLVLHIASVQVDWQSGKVTLAVDTDGRHYLELAQIVQRNREARQDPAKHWRHQLRRSAQTSDSLIGWDQESGAGIIRPQHLDGDTWNTFPIVAGEQGTISRLEMQASNPARQYAVAIFADHVGPKALNHRLGNPLAKVADGDEDVWAANADWLIEDERLLVYSAGTHDEPCGFWPRRHTNNAGEVTDHPVNGRHRDDASFDYWTTRRPFLWMAVYPFGPCTIEGRLWVVFGEGA